MTRGKCTPPFVLKQDNRLLVKQTSLAIQVIKKETVKKHADSQKTNNIRMGLCHC